MGPGEWDGDAVVPASGTVSLQFGPGARGRTWRVEQVSIQMDSAPLGSYARLLKGDRLITPMLTTDVAGTGPPVYLQGTETLTVTWYSVTAGLLGRVKAFYVEE